MKISKQYRRKIFDIEAISKISKQFRIIETKRTDLLKNVEKTEAKRSEKFKTGQDRNETMMKSGKKF